MIKILPDSKEKKHFFGHLTKPLPHLGNVSINNNRFPDVTPVFNLPLVSDSVSIVLSCTFKNLNTLNWAFSYII